MSNVVTEVQTSLKSISNTEKAVLLARFFKTGKGQYGEGDKFMGVVVPNIRKVAKEWYKTTSLTDIQVLLSSPFHEVRLCALIMLVYQYIKANEKGRRQIFDLYLKNTKYINNWDLVDLTAPHIVGEFLLNRNVDNDKGASTEDTCFAQTMGFTRGVQRKQNTVSREILHHLAQSSSLWERRIAVLATFANIKEGRAEEALYIAEVLIHDPHDLMHKAVGWMLREVGKRVSKDALRTFLDKHAKTMPRTMLRYAIEHFDERERRYYLE